MDRPTDFLQAHRGELFVSAGTHMFQKVSTT